MRLKSDSLVWSIGSTFLTAVALSSINLAQAATNDLTSMLQKGLFEEEANHNYSVALSAYESVVSRFDEDRKLAATAVFRIGEIYRKQGKTNEATVQYQRVIRDFADQTTLVSLSQAYVGTPGRVPANPEDALLLASEADEIKRIRAMIKESPDLINAKDSSFVGSGTRLHQAASHGQLKVAEFLIANGADVEAKDINGRTALYSAAEAGNKAMVELLLEKSSRINTRDNEGTSPLHAAARKGYMSVANLLLARGADGDAKNNREATPLHMAVAFGFKSIAELLLTHGANPNIPGLVWDEANLQYAGAPLHVAATRGDVAISELLLTNHAQVDLPNQAEETPLTIASRKGDLAVSRVLLAHGANVNFLVRHGLTPLGYAVGNQHTEMTRLLLESGADPNARFEYSSSPLRGSLSISGNNQPGGWTALLLATLRGNADIVDLLLANKADPNLKSDDGSAAIFNAIGPSFPLADRKRMLTGLLDHHADLETQSSNGNTPLLLAATWGDRDLIELFLSYHADVKAKDPNGSSAFHMLAVAAQKPQSVIPQAELLLKAGADVNAINNQGLPALIYVASPGFKAQIEYESWLREHGAIRDMPDFTSVRLNRANEYPIQVFRRDTNSLNRFSVFEVLGQHYLNSLNGGSLRFPNLSAIRILRPVPGKPAEKTEIPIFVLSVTNTFDRSRDQLLEFGDIVEIPEREHALNESPIGLTQPQRGSLIQCLQRRVTFVVKGQPSQVTLFDDSNDTAYLSVAMRKPAVQAILRSSCDFTRVKIKRMDRATKQMREITENVEPFWKSQPGSISDDLWLRDGDVIEITDKT